MIEKPHRQVMDLGAVLLWLGRCVKMPPMLVLMLLSAVLFLAGAAHAALAGAALFAKIGVLGAIAAIAFIAAFS